MLEKEDAWQKYDAWGLGPRMLSSKEFFEEMARPASRFKSPLSAFEKLQFNVQRFFSERAITKDLPMYIESGVPLNWQLILNYLYREGILETTTPLVGSFRNDKPKIPYIGLKPHYDASVTDAVERTFLGHGSSSTFDETISKAVGELLERYMGTYYKRESFFRASTQEMEASGRNFLSPEACSQFLPWQKERFSDFAFTKETPFRWVEAHELTQNKKVFIPAQLTFWLYDRTTDREPMLGPMSSSGMAGGFTRTEAIVSAIREYVERDSFLVYWMNTLSPQVIDVRDADQDLQDLEKYLRRYNIKAYFLNTTSDTNIPSSVCVLVYDEGGDPLITVGASAGGTAIASLLGACNEAIMNQSLAVGKRTAVHFSFQNYEPFVRSDINIDTRTYIWQGREMLEKIQFFLTGETISFKKFASLFPVYESSEDELASLVRQISSLGEGYAVYVADKHHTALDVLGYHVVKVFLPKMLPMYLNEHLAPLAAPRLHEVVPKLAAGSATLNIYPHPFP